MQSTAPNQPSEETALTILNDHYKDTFGHIRERERQRDRLFFVVVGLITLIFVEVIYPKNLAGALEAAGIQGLKVNVTALPIHVIVSATWTALGAVVIRYYQSIVHVERQYEYLHQIESKIERKLTPTYGEGAFRREGFHYLATRAVFSDWVWMFYSVGFPIIVFLGTSSVLWLEVQEQTKHTDYVVYDAIVALVIWISIILYQVARFRDWRDDQGGGERQE
jgi:hypothetical protein